MAASVEQVLRDSRPLIVTRSCKRLWTRFVGWVSRGRVPEPAALPLLAVAFAVLELALWPFDLGTEWKGVGWMALATVLIIALLSWSDWAWERVQQLGAPIDRLLPDGERGSYVEEVRERLPPHRLRHLLQCAWGAALAVGWSLVAEQWLPEGTLGPGFYVVLALLGFLATDNIRWFTRVPWIFLRPLTRISPLRVVLHAPAKTPAIREMARLAAETAGRAAAGFFIFGLALLWVVLSAKGGHGDSLAWWAIGPAAATLGTVFYAAFVPQYWLAQVIERERDRVLDELATELPEQGPDLLGDENAEKKMKLYDSVASAPTATTEGRALFQRGLVVLGALAPQLYALSVELLGINLPGS